ncbi:hypothetical protein [Candidatus Borrarchaeum sp.]|uniref:hypothetical protein n=1 Tax=Candidatus Borrarchaeum sp. TaxID=2846742 RepID=UPI00257EA1DB|nr:hypothetical protein [Candidatus Borrarchaeum sp.]
MLDILNELKEKLLFFLNKMKGKNGFYKYSLSGDLYDENVHWGLGNSVFALKIYYMIDALKQIDIDAIYDFIVSFQKSNGYFYDDYLHRRTLSWGRIFRSLKKLRLRNLLRGNEKRAETRQSFSTLFMINKKPPIPFRNFPKSKKSIDKYLSSLNWNMPWNAGSHFSHLVFFLFNMKKFYPNLFDYDVDKLTNHVLEWLNRRLQRNDGSWYIGNTTLSQKINGAMKIITGLNIMGEPINNPEKLIDLALNAINNRQACDNFNIVYVLYNCAKTLNFSYRQHEIEEFFKERLEIYRQYYYEDIGGFSFYPNRSDSSYYGVKITKGFNEPDIHGTVMFTWGIGFILEALGINKEIGLKSFEP